MVEYPGLFDGMLKLALEIALAVLPLLVVFALAQLTFLRLRSREMGRMAVGLILAAIGLWLFLQGVHVTFVPLGSQLGTRLIIGYPVWLLIVLGFVLGFLATVAEPAVRILNDGIQRVSTSAISSRVVMLAISCGVGLSVSLAMVRAVFGLELWYFVLPGYTVALVAVHFMRRDFGSIAFDAAAVATGPMTVTFIVALAVGVATGLDDRNPLVDGFGLVALVAMMPILSVLAVGVLYGPGQRGTTGTEATETDPQS